MTSAGNPSIGTPRWAQQALQAALRASYVLLVVYHTFLLAWHVWEGRLLQPETSIRWVLGGMLFAGFLWLRRLEIPLFWGRKAVVLWLLVALLHAHAALRPVEADGVPGQPGAVVALLIDDVRLVVVAFSLLLLAWCRRRQAVLGALRRSCWLAREPRVIEGLRFYSNVCSSRPPPCY